MNTFGTLLALLAISVGARASESPDVAAVIRSAELNATRPYFVPTHVRVTTTIRFPAEIGPPDGSVGAFTEDAAKQPGDYLVTWQAGDAYFTLTPLKDAPLANLNVPYQGQTYVFFFYQVADPLRAAASVNLAATAGTKTPLRDVPRINPQASDASAESSPSPTISRTTTAPPPGFTAPSAAQLVGFLDRLKLIHSMPIGPKLSDLAKAMEVNIAVRQSDTAGHEAELGERIDELPSILNEAGLYQIILLRVVRDGRLNALGFICLLRNTSDLPLTFDVASFGARCGACYLPQRISDAPAVLAPRSHLPAYFVINPGRNEPLLAANDWRITIDLVSPQINPGAAITRSFGQENTAP